MYPIKVLAGTGLLGTGFSESSFQFALNDNPDVIGCDAGSSDPGPYYLGAGQSITSRQATKRDLRLLLKGALEKDIPLLVGSSGTSGCNKQVDWTKEILEEIATEDGLSFKAAFIYSELDPANLKKYILKNKLSPLKGAPDFQIADVDRLHKIVGQMGPHPYIEALRNGAQVVIAGRSSDTSIYAALPIMRGVNNGLVWHSAKVIECGAGCVKNRTHPDSMMAYIYPDHFIVSPPNLDMSCTPNSVASHLLYENSSTHQLLEPDGALDTTNAIYNQIDDRSVSVSGSEFIFSDKLTIKLEGVEFLGYRKTVIGGIDDPYILRNLEDFLSASKRVVNKKVKESLSVDDNKFNIIYRVYGNPNNIDFSTDIISGQVGLLIEVVADTKELSQAIISIAWHTILHQPIKEWSGLISNLALPFSPPDADMGPVYQFIINHVIEVDDPCELFDIKYKQIRGS